MAAMVEYPSWDNGALSAGFSPHHKNSVLVEAYLVPIDSAGVPSLELALKTKNQP